MPAHICKRAITDKFSLPHHTRGHSNIIHTLSSVNPHFAIPMTLGGNASAFSEAISMARDGVSLFRSTAKAVMGKTKDTSHGIQKTEMANARLGIAYALGHIEMKKATSFHAAPFSTLVGNPQIAKDAASVAGKAGELLLEHTPLKELKEKAWSFIEEQNSLHKVNQAATAVIDGISEIKSKLKAIIGEFFTSLLDMIKKRYGVNTQVINVITDFLIWGANTFAAGIASALPAWGYVKTGLAIYADARTAVFKTKDLVSQLYSGYGVELLGGHPSVIASALARHSAAGIASAAKGLAISSTSLGLSIAADASGGSGVAGMVIGIITSILTKVFNLIESCIQKYKVTSTLIEARDIWRNHSSGSCILNDHKRFTKWFQESVVFTPIIASLAINSGFAAHPYRFLQLINSTGGIDANADIKKGVHHIDKLKGLASQHIRDFSAGYGVSFASSEAIIESRLKEALTGKSVLNDYEFILEVT